MMYLLMYIFRCTQLAHFSVPFDALRCPETYKERFSRNRFTILEEVSPHVLVEVLADDAMVGTEQPDNMVVSRLLFPTRTLKGTFSGKNLFLGTHAPSRPGMSERISKGSLINDVLFSVDFLRFPIQHFSLSFQLNGISMFAVILHYSQTIRWSGFEPRTTAASQIYWYYKSSCTNVFRLEISKRFQSYFFFI